MFNGIIFNTGKVKNITKNKKALILEYKQKLIYPKKI